MPAQWSLLKKHQVTHSVGIYTIMTTLAIIIDCWDQTFIVPEIVKYLKHNPVDHVVLASYHDLPTDTRLLRYLWTQKTHVAYTLEELVPIINEYNVDTIYVMGTAWEECIHYRPIGILALEQLSKTLPFQIRVHPRTVSCYSRSQHIMSKYEMMRNNLLEQSDLWKECGDYFVRTRHDNVGS